MAKNVGENTKITQIAVLNFMRHSVLETGLQKLETLFKLIKKIKLLIEYLV